VQASDPVSDANVPAGHDTHAEDEEDALLGLNRPVGQAVHWLIDDAPESCPYVPAGQAVQFVTPTNAPYLPAGHDLQDCEPGDENWPAPQSRQVDKDTALKLEEYVPPGHKIQLDNPVSLPYVPRGQLSQLDDPFLAWNEPIVQFWHSLMLFAPSSLPYRPAGHAYNTVTGFGELQSAVA
jgi:hypothetical protein